jgi:hypothetical protein
MRFIKKFKDLTEWHDFFCLIPKVVSSTDTEYKIAWLETIERKKVYEWYGYSYQYRFKNRK